MTDRLLLALVAAFNAVNGALVGAASGGVVAVPNELLLAVSVVSLGLAAFVGAFLREPSEGV